MMTHVQLREKFTKFWKQRDHKEVPPIPLVPQNDPTTLFTGSGMQPLVPYLLGEPHPQGKRLYNIQPCFRSQDIEEVGDNRHTTFFEMMGNWSLGDYFKKEQLAWFWEFLTEVIKLPKEKLYVSVFAGTKDLPADEESLQIWKKIGIPESHIFKYGVENNWWSRAGAPENMRIGEPGGPDSEVFFEFTQVPHNLKYGKTCHPNCDCGRFLEVGNSVFMQYKKESDGTFQELSAKNVDFGGGLERTLAALNNEPDVFKIDLFNKIIKVIEKYSKKSYSNDIYKLKMRVITDHLKGACFMAQAGIEPSNKEQGYIMRRLIRRAMVKMMELDIVPLKIVEPICTIIVNTYYPVYFKQNDFIKLTTIIGEEIDSFELTVGKGVKILQNQPLINGKILFDLKQSYGFPFELAVELLKQWGKSINKLKIKQEFDTEFKKHKNLSRTSSAGMFKGGLADHSAQTIKYHTATHLLHQALFDVLGDSIKQEGSHITGERLRFDFYSSIKPSYEQIKKAELIIDKKVKESLPVTLKIIPREEAYNIGARSFFREKYPETVKVYFIEGYSKEFCAGPHVKNTAEIGKIKIYKFEKIGSNLYRIYAK